MSRKWTLLLLAGLLPLAGCTETNRLDDSADTELPAEDARAAERLDGDDDQYAADGQADETARIGGDTEVAPQHVMKPEVDGSTIQPIASGEAAEEAVPTPESTPERKDTGQEAIEESLIDKPNPDSQDLNDRVDQALDLNDKPAAEKNEETKETLRPEDEPIRDKPITDTPTLDQEQLGEEIAPEDPTDAFGEDEEFEKAKENLDNEEKAAVADALTEAVGKADDEIGEAAETLEENIEETLEAVSPEESDDTLPPTLPLEDPEAARKPAEKSKFDATVFKNLDAQKDMQAANKQVKQAERELAMLRTAITNESTEVKDAATHLESLRDNLDKWKEAKSDEREPHAEAVAVAAKALAVSLKEARMELPQQATGEAVLEESTDDDALDELQLDEKGDNE